MIYLWGYNKTALEGTLVFHKISYIIHHENKKKAQSELK